MSWWVDESWLVLGDRFEEVNIRRREGVAKVVGTAICIGGAVTMSVYKGIALFGGNDAPDAGLTMQPFAHLGAFLHNDLVSWSVNKFHLGIFFLIMNCVSWAVYLTCQVHNLLALHQFLPRLFALFIGAISASGWQLGGYPLLHNSAMSSFLRDMKHLN